MWIILNGMNAMPRLVRALGFCILAAAGACLCLALPASAQEPAKKVPIGKSGKVFLEIKGKERRVLVEAYVCQRKGRLEQFLTRTRTKEHEAILAVDANAKDIHVALTLAGAEAGKPVTFEPKYMPASGTRINVFVEYQEKGKTVRAPAQQWIRNVKTQKDLDQNWVFGGSRFFQDPFDQTKDPYYLANDGDVICLSNFDTAMLDLPIESTRDNDELVFEAHTERIPAVETAVTVILEPVLKKK